MFMLKPRTFKAIKFFKTKDIGSLLNPQSRRNNLFSSFQRYFFLKSNCKIYNCGLIGLVNMSHKRMFCTEVSKEEEKKTQKPKYEEPEVPEEELKKLEQQITRISQCMNLGMYKDAKMLLEKYKVDLSKYYSQDHPAYCSYENNLGVLLRLNGQFEDAYDILLTTYNKYLKLYGKHHPSTISCLVNLATVLRDLKDYDQSIKYYEEARVIRREIEGEHDPNYAVILGMSAGAYRLKGDTEKAYKYLKEAYTIMANYYKGEECTPCAVILNSLGMLYKQEKKYDRAADAYDRCLKIREKLIGKSHPDTISVRHSLGELYLAWEKPDKAKEYHDENLKIMQEVQEKQRQANM